MFLFFKKIQLSVIRSHTGSGNTLMWVSASTENSAGREVERERVKKTQKKVRFKISRQNKGHKSPACTPRVCDCMPAWRSGEQNGPSFIKQLQFLRSLFGSH